jgi:TonB-linked SusC/RagA family outer membrane protein
MSKMRKGLRSYSKNNHKPIPMITNLHSRLRKVIKSRIISIPIYISFLLGILFIPFPAKATAGQLTPINLKIENETLKEVLQRIEEQCEYTFVYNASKIDIMQTVSVDFINADLEEVLQDMLSAKDIKYEYVNNKIVLTPKGEDPAGKADPQDQEGIRITGTVTDASTGTTLPGVSIIVKGTVIGTVTDADGKYSIEVPDELSVLVFSFVGFEKVEVLADKPVIDIALRPKVTQLDEMVVVGYGSSSKRLLTSSVGTVKAEAITLKPISNVEQALQGNATGIQVVSNSGTPGGGISVRVRGVSSINAGSNPLYVVDGIPIITGDFGQIGFSGQNINALSDINPNDIESISVLKDASATTIYGSRASNGVILITTKKGTAEKSKISFNAYYGFQEVVKKLDMLNAREFMEYKNEASIAAGGLPVYTEEEIESNTIDTDWLNEVLSVAPIGNFELSATGGSKSVKYYLSGNYFTQTGTLIGTAYDRVSGRANIDADLNKVVSIGANIGLSYSMNDRKEGDQSLNSPLANAIAMPAIYPVYNPDGSFNDDGPFANPVSIGNLHLNESNAFRSISSIYADIRILKGLTFTTKWAADFYNLREHTYDPPTTRQGAKYNGLGIEATANVTNIVSNNILRYFTEFKEKHHLNALLGYSFEIYQRRSSFLRGQDFPNENFQYINSAAVITSGSTSALDRGLNSFFGEVKYDFDYKYLITLSARYDGSSKFGENNQYGFFPAASAAWRISEEDFFNVRHIDDLKIRTSYGLTGNDGIPDFAYMNLYTAGSDYQLNPGIYPSQLPNPDLKWESTAQFNLGLDLSMLKGRLTFNFDYYNKYTKDLLLYRPVPPSSGFSSYISNIGEMKNNGFEFLLTAKIIDTEFKWDVNTNFSLNRNEVTKLYNDQPIDQIGRGENSVRVGLPIGVFYNYESLGVDPSTGDLVFRDVDGDGEITENDRTVIGDPNPDFIGAFTNNFSYKGFTLTIMMQYSYGNDVFNGTRRYIESMKGQDNQLRVILDRWRQPGDITQVPRATNADLNNNDRASSRFIEDGSYLRFKTVRLSYDFQPNVLEKLRLERLQLYLVAQNLFTITNYSGMDPEVNYAGDDDLRYGTDFFTYPTARIISMGINLQF